jgi:hypothetical protein
LLTSRSFNVWRRSLRSVEVILHSPTPTCCSDKNIQFFLFYNWVCGWLYGFRSDQHCSSEVSISLFLPYKLIPDSRLDFRLFIKIFFNYCLYISPRASCSLLLQSSVDCIDRLNDWCLVSYWYFFRLVFWTFILLFK